LVLQKEKAPLDGGARKVLVLSADIDHLSHGIEKIMPIPSQLVERLIGLFGVRLALVLRDFAAAYEHVQVINDFFEQRLFSIAAIPHTALGADFLGYFVVGRSNVCDTGLDENQNLEYQLHVALHGQPHADPLMSNESNRGGAQ
jgi:hypothetical protein